ncbi:MAG: hydantoinase/oxoprolinase family protein [Chloroflexi bacterium]|nr:hydantoinase/oxoprolinase family protein [Chloroflexota bacterium]
MQPTHRAGVDIGGTFTDLILVDDATGQLVVGKTLTTPRDPSLAVEQVLAETLGSAAVTPARLRTVVHGTTLVTNTIIERKGARTALLTTRGFRDAIEIATESRYELYDIFIDMPRPLVPRYLRLDVDERTFADGSIGRPLDDAEVEALARELQLKGVQAVGVCFLHSYANPEHERRARAAIERVAPGLRVSISSDVVPEIREYERTSTTLANVYVQELVDRYLRELERRLDGLGFRGALFVMLSSGGIATVETAVRHPIRLLESGPAAGALATAHYGAVAGYPSLLSFDMGGTTAKLCVVEGGQPLTASQFEVDRVYRFKRGSGLPVKVPVIEMIEIGAGGGSIAHLDSLGLLKVGPESAGADPGPVCYGRGGSRPTVTDADLVLGYLDPGFFLGGRMALEVTAARRAIEEQIAQPLGIDVVEAAWGVHQIVNESMANAARVHAIERGKDPRGFPLFCFGGAGPVHGFRVAEILHAPAMIAPFGAGVTATVGFLVAPLAFDFVRSFYGRLGALRWSEVAELYDEMEREGLEVLAASGVPASETTLIRSADMRYVGQGYEVRVPVPIGPLTNATEPLLRESFETVYRRLYQRVGPAVGAEVVNWRLVVSGPRPEVKLREADSSLSANATGALKGHRDVYVREHRDFRSVPVYDRYRLGAGATFDGPAIVEERESTVVIGPGGRATIDEFRNLRVNLS